MASRSLSDLHPTVREKTLKWLDACKAAGVDVLVYCTYRSAAEQDELYKIGRTVKGDGVTARRPMGRRVTDARGGESFHQYRCAWDAVPLVFGKTAWGDEPRYAIMGACAKKLGIEWAGSWVQFKETAHFQFTGGRTLAELQSGKEVV